ncbi:MAG TPA: heavy-metal-associated domain-containing protein [Vineibacter sp.]|nr:heavy-metal-associated domain-containing protein [Vineibacter sp.]
MHRYTVPTMTCGHCAATIEKAVKGVDPQATLSVNLPAKEVTIHSGVEETRIAEAIRAAGYETRRVAA